MKNSHHNGHHAMCPTGIPGVGDARWGTHFCQFYRTKQDLIDTIVPYFTNGLRNNEFCICIASPAMSPEEILEHMERAVPEFQHRLADGQFEVHDYNEWYRSGSLDDVLEKWMQRYHAAITRGFNGMRLSGDTQWVHGSGWEEFIDYEHRVNESFGKHRLIGLCTYCLEKCGGDDVLDVVRTHQYVIARRKGQWELLEGKALRSAREEIERVADHTRNLAQAVQERDRFLAMLGHELRNPLAAIRTASELLAEQRIGPEQMPELRNMIVRQTGHLGRIIDDLLDVSRITTGKLTIEQETLNFSELVLTAVNDFQAAPIAAHITVEVTCRHPSLTVCGSRTRLTQIVTNLLDNAAKFSSPGGVVHVRLTKNEKNEQALLEVADQGVGIDPVLLGRLFDPFAQADLSMDRSRGGLGLGLAVVRGLTELHGGSVSAKSEGQGKGASFTVRLPHLECEEAPVDEDLGAMPSRASLRILVIEDNTDAAESLRMTLALDGHTVTVAHTGSQGIVKALLFKPHLVMCDIGLPHEMSGYAVAQRLRAEPLLRSMMLVALTGYGLEDDKDRAKSAGFDFHVTKPVELKRLRSLIRECVSRIEAAWAR